MARTRTTLRKALAALLAAALALSLGGLPAAYGAEAGVATDGMTAGVAPQSVPVTGTCGDSLTWSLDLGSGTLTIEGSGDMGDFRPSPWNGYRDAIEHVVISSGVATIGDDAFWFCSSLSSVSIPEGVESIGASAFSYCPSLSSISIPEGVETIGAGAFASCTSLESISIPESVESIGYAAFNGCTSLASIAVAGGNAKYASEGGVLFDKDKAVLIRCPEGSVATTYGIPSTVTEVGDYAFSGCPSLESVSIPEGIESIGDSAFSGCTALASAPIPASVVRIGSGAFEGCTALVSVSIPEGVESIGIYAFSGCTSLVSIAVAGGNAFYSSDDRGTLFDKGKAVLICYPEGSVATTYGIPPTVTEIGPTAFSGCASLVSVTIPEGVESIGGLAFSGCTSLVSVAIPSTATSIWSTAFTGCTSLASITVAKGNAAYSSEGGVLFYKGKTMLICYPAGKDATAYDIPPSVTEVGFAAFEGCASLVSVTIPEGVETIGAEAFGGCTSLVSVTIPEGVKSIYPRAFGGCTSLASVFIPASVAVVEYNAFAACTATIYCEAASRPVGWSSDWNSGLFGQVLWGQAGLPAPPDTEGPVLGAASAARRSASVAAVSFAGSEAGSYYWAVVAQGAPAPAIGTAGAGTPLKAGPQTLEVTGLADGRAWDVCLIAKDAAGNLGTVTRVGVPAWAYTVAFRGWDGRALGVPQRVSHGLGAVAPKAPARTGHTFVGWDRGFASVTTDLTVTAKYRADTCTVRLDANGGKVAGKAATSVKKTYGSALGKLPTPVRTGYSFQGWYTGKVKGTKVGSATKVTKAATYYAHWKAKGPVVTLDANGGKVGKAATASVVRSKGKAMGRLATPTRAGYSFLGWFTGKVKGTRVTAATKATRSVTLYAHWKAKSYTVRLNANGGKVGKASVFSTKKSHNSKFGRLAIPKRTGYQFLGWYTGKAKGTKVTASTKVTKAVTLYAHWKRVR